MIKSRILLMLIISLFLSSCASIAPEQAPSLDADALKSPSGFRAEFVKTLERGEGEGDGEGKTVIWKRGQVITEIPNSRPLSFSPTADVLLLAEHAPDDDLRQYLLNIGGGEISKEGGRINYVFGGRYLNSAVWSADGKTITLHYHELLSEVRSETFEVARLLEH